MTAKLSRPRRRYGVDRPPPDWTGITDGFDARCTCTWANGPADHATSRVVYQIKRADRACLNPVHAAAALAGRGGLWEG